MTDPVLYFRDHTPAASQKLKIQHQNSGNLLIPMSYLNTGLIGLITGTKGNTQIATHHH